MHTNKINFYCIHTTCVYTRIYSYRHFLIQNGYPNKNNFSTPHSLFHLLLFGLVRLVQYIHLLCEDLVDAVEFGERVRAAAKSSTFPAATGGGKINL